MLTNTDITVFNRVVFNREDILIRTHIYGVHWEDKEGSRTANPGTLKVDSSRIFIPFDAEIERDKTYVKPKAFERNREGRFTFQVDDLIVKGIVKEEITRAKELEEKYDDVRTISYIDTVDYGSPQLRHWEVGCV